MGRAIADIRTELLPLARTKSPTDHQALLIARTLRSHRALILNYFHARKQFSSGVVEGLNNKAKLTMRESYGFRTFHVTEIALYHALGRLPEPDVAHRFF